MNKKEKTVKPMIPKSTAEAKKLIQEIGEFQVKQQEIERRMSEEVKKIKNEAVRKIGFKLRAIQRRMIGLFIFYQNNWGELTQEGKIKTVNLISGQIGSYLTPPAVSIRNKEKVLKALETKGLNQFIRIIKEIDKEAILIDPAQASEVPGIKITQKERFMVKPAETELPVSEDVKKLKKFLL